MAIWRVPTLLTTEPSMVIRSAAVTNVVTSPRLIRCAAMPSVISRVGTPISARLSDVSRAPCR
jgi:hypothetical protein